MSIINTVLQEIEKNKRKNNQLPKLPNLSLDSSFKRYKRRAFNGFTIVITLLVVLIFVAAVFYIMPRKAHAHKAQVAALFAKQTQNSLNTTSSNKNIVPPTSEYGQLEKTAAVKLEEITLSADKSKTTINFKLSGETYYYLEHGQDQKQLNLTLGNTSYDREISPDFTHTAVKKMQMRMNGNSVKAAFDLLPDTQVISLQLYHDAGAEPILQLVLLNTGTPSGTVSKETVPLTAQERAMKEYEDALNLVAQDKEDVAIDKLRGVIRAYKDDAGIYELLATLLIKNDKLEQAMRVLNEAGAHYPNNPHFVQLQAYVLSQQGNGDKAMQLLLRNPPEIVNDPNYYVYVANIYQQQGQFMLAAKLYDKLVKIQPGNAMWWVGLGVALESASQNNAAREAYIRALELGGNLPQEVQAFLQNKLKGRR